MPWPEVSRMDGRLEFVRLALCEGSNVSALCRRFGVSRKTGHKWLARAAAGAASAGGADAGGAARLLADRSRRPGSSPGRTGADVEARVVALRREQPSWGGRKLRRRLQDQGMDGVPSASTITAILGRHGLLSLSEAARHAPFQRFEHPRPNALWQMDFKGHFALGAGRCHPLTVLDDHSRYSVCLQACADETTATVQAGLVAAFRRLGLPERLNVDNGPPWGDGAGVRHTPLTVWLLQLGVRVSHSRPYHPQTNGKDERFHRTLKRDVLFGRSYPGLADAQAAFDRFREVYNAQRPHEALGLCVPASRYQPSPRSYPEAMPAVEYDPADQVRRVQQGGWISFKGQMHRLPQAFAGHAVALRPTTADGIWEAMFVAERVAQIDLRHPLGTQQPVTHLPEQV